MKHLPKFRVLNSLRNFERVKENAKKELEKKKMLFVTSLKKM